MGHRGGLGSASAPHQRRGRRVLREVQDARLPQSRQHDRGRGDCTGNGRRAPHGHEVSAIFSRFASELPDTESDCLRLLGMSRCCGESVEYAFDYQNFHTLSHAGIQIHVCVNVAIRCYQIVYIFAFLPELSVSWPNCASSPYHAL